MYDFAARSTFFIIRLQVFRRDDINVTYIYLFFRVKYIMYLRLCVNMLRWCGQLKLFFLLFCGGFFLNYGYLGRCKPEALCLGKNIYQQNYNLLEMFSGFLCVFNERNRSIHTRYYLLTQHREYLENQRFSSVVM